MIKSIKNLIKTKINYSYIFEYLIKTQKTLQFIQIGGHDGVSFDTFFSYFKRIEPCGVILEPIYQYYTELNENIKNYPKIKTINKAIHNSSQSIHMYKIKNQYLNEYQDWIRGCASFNKDNILKHGVTAEKIESVLVSCVNINEIFYNFPYGGNINYFQTDCEGYDGQIILDLDLNLYRPSIIKFEFVNLKSEELKNVKRKLRKNSYILLADKNDYIAIKSTFFLKLLLD